MGPSLQRASVDTASLKRASKESFNGMAAGPRLQQCQMIKVSIGYSWRVVGRDDHHSLYSDQYDVDLRDGLPEEMIAAVQTTAQAINDNWSVTHFVWTLEPRPVGMAPISYGEAVAPGTRPRIGPKATTAVAEYFASVGLMASETSRRAFAVQQRAAARSSLPLHKKAFLKVVYSSPGLAAAFRGVYTRLRSGRGSSDG